MSFTPVDFDPFQRASGFTPVDFNPFESEEERKRKEALREQERKVQERPQEPLVGTMEGMMPTLEPEVPVSRPARIESQYQPPVTPEEQMAEATLERSVTDTLPKGSPVSERPLEMPVRQFSPRTDRTDALMLGLVADKAIKERAEITRPGPTIEAAKRLEQENIIALARDNFDSIAAAVASSEKLFDEYEDLSKALPREIPDEPKEQRPLTYKALSAGARFLANMGDVAYSMAEIGQENILDPQLSDALKPQIWNELQKIAAAVFPRDEEGKIKRLEFAEKWEKKSKELSPERFAMSMDAAIASGTLFPWLLSQAANSADSVMMSLAVIAKPELAPIIGPTIFANVYGGQYSKERGFGKPVREAAFASQTFASAETAGELLEAYGFRVAGKALVPVLQKASVAERDAFAATLMGRVLKNVAVLSAASAGGMASEYATSILQDLSTKYISKRDPGDMLKNAREAGAVGAFLGPFLAGTAAIEPALQRMETAAAERDTERIRLEALEKARGLIIPSPRAETPSPIPLPAAGETIASVGQPRMVRTYPTPIEAPTPPVATRSMEQVRDEVQAAQDLDSAIATADQAVAEVPTRAQEPVTPEPTPRPEAVEARAQEAAPVAPIAPISEEPTREQLLEQIALSVGGERPVAPVAPAAPEVTAAPRIEVPPTGRAPVAPEAPVEAPRVPPTGRVEAAAPMTMEELAASFPVTPPAAEAAPRAEGVEAAPAQVFDDFVAVRDIPSRGIAKGEVVSFPTEKQALAYAREQKVPETYTPREVETGWVLSRAAPVAAPAAAPVTEAAPARAEAERARLEANVVSRIAAPDNMEVRVFRTDTGFGRSIVDLDSGNTVSGSVVRFDGADALERATQSANTLAAQTRGEAPRIQAPPTGRGRAELLGRAKEIASSNILGSLSPVLDENVEAALGRWRESGERPEGRDVVAINKKLDEAGDTKTVDDYLREATATLMAETTTAPVFTDATAPKKTKRFQKGEVVTFTSEKQAAAYAKAQKLEGYTPREVDGVWRLSRRPQGEITVGLSAATPSILGISELYKSANAGDELAHTTLQLVAEENIKHLLSRTNAKVITNATTGLYGGAIEPSLTMSVTFDEADRASVLAALAKFASNFNQEQIHVRIGSNEDIGFTYDDGSYVTPVYRLSLESPLSRKEIENVIEQSGLYGLTFSDSTIEAYFVGDPSNEGEVNQFKESIRRAEKLLEGKYSGIEENTERLWTYGDGERGLGFDTIQGDVPAGEGISNETARKIAAYLNAEVDVATGRRRFGPVKTFEQQDISPQQEALQTRIAEAYDAMPVNDLDNPNVRRAYEELADEVLRQYKAIPTKVEVYSGKAEPYKNSEEMRRDLLDNNHLFIYATTPETFGPPGQDFADHPLLKDSGLKDQNGYRLLFNDLLRAVHDYYAHSMSPVQFGPKGEEAAWKNHMAMTRSPWARWALTAETRGQNSWVNFRPDLDRATPAKDRPFAEQKAALLPLEFSLTGDNEVDAPVTRLIETIGKEASMGSLGRQPLGEERAVQEPSAAEVPVLPRTRGGEAVGERDAQRQEAAREGRAGEAGAEEVGFRDLNRSYISQTAYLGYEVLEKFPQPSRRLNGLLNRLEDGKISEGTFIYQVRQLSNEMNAATRVKADVVRERERGADIVMEKLIAARRRGELPPETVEFGLWLLRQNPGIASELGISIKTSKDASIAAGLYNPAAKIMAVFKMSSNVGTAVHEILHHSERMMSADVQSGIRVEWQKAYAKALSKAKGEERLALLLVMDAMAGDPKAKSVLLRAFKTGVLDYDKHYQLVNPSEYWAVNATRILRRRYDANSWIAKAKNWLIELVERAKGAFGMRSDAYIIKGLNDVISGKAKEPTGKMLADINEFNDIKNQKTNAINLNYVGVKEWQINRLRNYQDRFIDLGDYVEEYHQMTGTPIPDEFNPRKLENLFSSKVAILTKEFRETKAFPIYDKMAELGVTKEEIEDYLYARHAPEYNREMEKRNPTQEQIDKKVADLTAEIDAIEVTPAEMKQVPEPENVVRLNKLKRDRQAWREVKPFEGTEEQRLMLSGMSDQQAQDYMDSLSPEKKSALEEIAAQWDGLVKIAENNTKGKTDDPSIFNPNFKFYVPFRREGFDEQVGGIPQGFSVKGKFTKAATGSLRPVTDILENIIAQAEASIYRLEANKIAQAMLGLAITSPNPDFWTVDQTPKKATLDMRTGAVVMRADPQYRNNPLVVIAKVPDGKGNVVERMITFNKDNPKAILMAAALKNLDIDPVTGWLNVLAAGTTRHIAVVNTQYNPFFGIRNLWRDLKGAFIQTANTPLAGSSTKIVADGIWMIPEIMALNYAEKFGRTINTKNAELYKEFRREGGQTFRLRDMWQMPEKRRALLEKQIRLAAASTPEKGARMMLNVVKGVTLDLLDAYNTTFENVIRLAAYKEAQKMGLSKISSAELAKEATVNFDRRGIKTAQMQVHFAFFNSAIQGNVRITKALGMKMERDGSISLSNVGKAIIGGGVLLGALQVALLQAFDIEEDDIKDEIKQKNFIIPLALLGDIDIPEDSWLNKLIDRKGGYLKSPMPLGYNFIVNLGRIPTEYVMGGFKNTSKHSKNLLNSFLDSWNPFGSGSVWEMAAPTWLDPVVALLRNQDWQGRSIYLEQMDPLDQRPGYLRAKHNASYAGTVVAYAINRTTGGTEFTSGLLSPTPDQIDYLIGVVVGGVGREAKVIDELIQRQKTGEETPANRLPLIRMFYGEVNDISSQTDAFYENIKLLKKHQAVIEGEREKEEKLLARGEPYSAKIKIMEYQIENPSSLALNKLDPNSFVRDMQNLNKEKREVIAKYKDSESPIDNLRMQNEVMRIDMQRLKLMSNFNYLMKAYKGEE